MSNMGKNLAIFYYPNPLRASMVYFSKIFHEQDPQAQIGGLFRSKLEFVGIEENVGFSRRNKARCG